MKINEIKKALKSKERIDMDIWSGDKGYRNAYSTLFWEYDYTLIFKGSSIKTRWYKDVSNNDYVQAAIFTNVKGFEEFEFIVIVRKNRNKYKETTATMHLYTNTPPKKAVEIIGMFGRKYSVFCYHQSAYHHYIKAKENNQ